MPESTSYAIVRNLLALGETDMLMDIIQDKVEIKYDRVIYN